MARVGSITTAALVGLLRSDAGISAAIAELAAADSLDLPAIAASQILPTNVSADLVDKSQGARYPILCVYCEKVMNRQREKFRRFSGTASMVVEVRASQDRVDGLEQRVQVYVDAVTQVLERSRGEWSEGVFYGGGYEINYGGVRQGGKNFLQTAKVSFELDVTRN
jgi:hypothetical protein